MSERVRQISEIFKNAIMGNYLLSLDLVLILFLLGVEAAGWVVLKAFPFLAEVFLVEAFLVDAFLVEAVFFFPAVVFLLPAEAVFFLPVVVFLLPAEAVFFLPAVVFFLPAPVFLAGALFDGVLLLAAVLVAVVFLVLAALLALEVALLLPAFFTALEVFLVAVAFFAEEVLLAGVVLLAIYQKVNNSLDGFHKLQIMEMA